MIIDMIKNISIFLFTLLLAGCFESNSFSNNKSSEKFDLFVSDMDGQSLKEIETEFDELIQQFDKFHRLINDKEGISSHKIEKINIEDERYIKAFSVVLKPIDSILDVYKNMKFEQQFSNNKSNLNFTDLEKDKKISSLLRSTKGAQLHLYFRMNKIIYDDGSIEVRNKEDKYQESLGEMLGRMDNLKSIKGIQANLKLKYTKSFDTVTLNNKEPKVKYKDGYVILKEIKDNYVYIAKTDSLASFLKIDVLNKEGKVLSNTGNLSSSLSPKEYKRKINVFLNSLKNIKKKIKNKDFVNTQELQTYLKSHVDDFSFFNGDGFYHKEIYSRGTAHSVKVHFSREKTTKEVEFTASNKSVSADVIEMAMSKNDETAFIDKKGEILFTVKGSDYYAINSRYFKDGDNYYFLNIADKKMEKLAYSNVATLSNGLIKVEAKEDDDYSLYDLNHKKVSENKYQYFDEYSEFVIGKRDDHLWIIDKEGKETRLNGIKKVYNSPGGIFPVRNDKYKYGFINSSGALVVPMIYSDIESFSGGLFVVAKNNLYGYMNIDGKLVVPPKYKYANKMINGVAKVTGKKGFYGFIDQTGKEIVPTIYIKAGRLYDGLIRVKSKERLYGFIDKTGNIVIPAIHEDATIFNSGHAMVKGVDGLYKLINTKGKTVLKTNTDNVEVIRSKGGDRLYKFRGNKYNASGKLMTK